MNSAPLRPCREVDVSAVIGGVEPRGKKGHPGSCFVKEKVESRLLHALGKDVVPYHS